jgi:hypothetical protein
VQLGLGGKDISLPCAACVRCVVDNDLGLKDRRWRMGRKTVPPHLRRKRRCSAGARAQGSRNFSERNFNEAKGNASESSVQGESKAKAKAKR